MLPEFINNLKQIVFTIPKNFKKTKDCLTRAENSVFIRKNEDIRVHQYSKPAFSIRYILLNMFNKASLSIEGKEPGIRLEAVLTGELTDTTNKEQIQIMRSGEYRLCDSPEYLLLFKRKSSCSYFITRYSDDLLSYICFVFLLCRCLGN